MQSGTKQSCRQWTVKFTSQSELFAWIERSRSTTRRRVQSMTLQLTDIDLSSLVQSRTDCSSQRARPTLFDLYEKELQKFACALDALPNLVEMTVLPPDRMLSRLLRSMYESFLAMIPQHCTSLSQLTVEHGENGGVRSPSRPDHDREPKIDSEVPDRERRDSGTDASLEREAKDPSAQHERPQRRTVPRA